MMEMFAPHSDTPLVPALSYFRTEPLVDDGLIAYDGIDHGVGQTSYWFVHTLGQIVTSCAGAGLGIVSLTEFGHSIREPDYDLYEGQAAQIPMSFLLHAQKT